ncbi:MAG: calcium/proton exchanger [Actinobacteria bacterium]|nr:MAG: calcium/proton exchanger [Actinomycetota bacterium]
MARRLLWASLAIAPITILLDAVVHPSKVVLFLLAAVSLVPLAWLIGEATEHAGEHTGPRIGGLLNASFGNAPELIIALVAIGDSLPNVVRGSLAGSVVSNILLVLGAALVVGGNAALDRRSLLVQLSLVAAAVLVLLVPSVPGWHGDPDRHSLAVLGIVPAIVLLVVYLVMTSRGVRGTAEGHEPEPGGWSLKAAIVALSVATLATAVISEILVHSLEAFAHAAHLSEFFIAFVIVAVVGNAAEHGGAVVIAHRGKMKLATEIAISSSAQVGLLVIPLVALVSFAFANPLTLAFRPVELGAMAAAAIFVGFVIRDGRSTRREGAVLISAYAVIAVVALAVGDRGG